MYQKDKYLVCVYQVYSDIKSVLSSTACGTDLRMMVKRFELINFSVYLLFFREPFILFYGWRTRLQPIRTAAEIPVHIKILPVQQPPLYQKFSQKAIELRVLGMTYKEIAASLKISEKTAKRACKPI